MKLNPDSQLETRISRELQSLGELPAPAGLARRIMQAVEAQAALPWYRRAWTSWPMGLQVTSALVLTFGFIGFCALAGELYHSANEAVLGQERPGWLSELSVTWNLVHALGSALSAVVDHLGFSMILTGALVIAGLCAASACLGTAYVRFAMNTARQN